MQVLLRHALAFIDLSSLRECTAYYPSCWLIVEPEKLKLNTFPPLIRRRLLQYRRIIFLLKGDQMNQS